eukprot:26920-Eustigmatos_ZCMA.PRE.1
MAGGPFGPQLSRTTCAFSKPTSKVPNNRCVTDYDAEDAAVLQHLTRALYCTYMIRALSQQWCYGSCDRPCVGDEDFHPRMCRWGSECLHVTGHTNNCQFYHEEDLHGIK